MIKILIVTHGPLAQALKESSAMFFGSMSNETSQFSFFRLSGQAGPEKRLYFVSRFIVLFCPAFIFRQKESDLEVNIPGALQGGEF